MNTLDKLAVLVYKLRLKIRKQRLIYHTDLEVKRLNFLANFIYDNVLLSKLSDAKDITSAVINLAMLGVIEVNHLNKHCIVVTRNSELGVDVHLRGVDQECYKQLQLLEGKSVTSDECNLRVFRVSKNTIKLLDAELDKIDLDKYLLELQESRSRKIESKQLLSATRNSVKKLKRELKED